MTSQGVRSRLRIHSHSELFTFFMELAFIILAAGKGTRMDSDLAKVLHPLCGKPLVAWVLEAANGLRPSRVVAVVGHQAARVQSEIKPRFPAVEYATQSEMLGTGHAVMQAEALLQNFDGDVIVTCGDAPLITEATFRALAQKREALDASAAMLYATVEESGAYGRVILDETKTTVRKIVEFKDATDEEKACRTVNAGTYCFRARDLWPFLSRIGNSNKSGEYYLTDVVGLMTEAGNTVAAVEIAPREMVGVNTKAELLALENELRAEGRCGHA